MGLYLLGGEFNEDFDYGYPYDKIVADSAPEFEYSGWAHVYDGRIYSTKYDRKGFTLHYRNNALEPKNYDSGIHSGSHTSNFHYLVFPVLQWDQAQILTLRLHLTDAATLSFDKSFDGFYKDHFYLVVNNVVRHHHDHTAGHGWTAMSLALGRGWNKIQWVLKTAKYDPPVVRGGDSRTSTKPPKLPRYLRITSININQNVDKLADGPHSRVKMIATGSLGTTAHLNMVGQATLLGRGHLYEGIASGAIFMSAHGSFITDWQTEREMGEAVLQGTSSLTINASVGQNHETDDGGMEVGTAGELTIKVPIDQPQTIADRIKLLQSVYYDFPEPVVVKGKMVMPRFRNTQTSTIATQSSYAYNDPIDPASIDHALRVGATYRWIAVDVAGADDSVISAWPERSSATNPQWQSAYDYKPSVHPHDHFTEEHLNVVTYSRVVRFYWRWVQHMWINLGTYPTGPHYTWQFVGIFHPSSDDRNQHIIDYGLPSPDAGAALDSDDDTEITENVGGKRSGFGLTPRGVKIFDTSVGWGRRKPTPVVTHRPQVITVVFGDNAGGHGGVTVYQHGHRLNNRINMKVPVTANPNFVLGRWHGRIARDWASHMSLMEMAFFDRALTATEVAKNATYLMGVYKFSWYR